MYHTQYTIYVYILREVRQDHCPGCSWAPRVAGTLGIVTSHYAIKCHKGMSSRNAH